MVEQFRRVRVRILLLQFRTGAVRLAWLTLEAKFFSSPKLPHHPALRYFSVFFPVFCFVLLYHDLKAALGHQFKKKKKKSTKEIVY